MDMYLVSTSIAYIDLHGFKASGQAGIVRPHDKVEMRANVHIHVQVY